MHAILTRAKVVWVVSVTPERVAQMITDSHSAASAKALGGRDGRRSQKVRNGKRPTKKAEKGSPFHWCCFCQITRRTSELFRTSHSY